MPNVETMKEYLVKIGYSYDKSAAQAIEDDIITMFSRLSYSSNKFISNLTRAATSLFDILYEINKTTASLVIDTANLDLETERLARRYWIAEDSARALDASLQSMGISFNDLFYATPEQYNRFLELSRWAQSLEAPEALDDTLIQIREIEGEFSKLKITIQYAFRWIVYYIGQINGKEIQDIKDVLTSFNDWAVEKLPKYTKKIAEFLTHVWQLGKAAVQLFKGIISMFQEIPLKAWGLVGVFSAIALAIKTGPFGALFTMLSAILLIIEDYMVYKEGGLYHFDWSKIEDSGVLKDLKKSWDELGESLGDVSDAFTDILRSMGLITDDTTALQVVLKGLNGTLKIMSGLLDGIASALYTISALMRGEESDAMLKFKGKMRKKYGQGFLDFFFIDPDTYSEEESQPKAKKQSFALQSYNGLNTVVPQSYSPVNTFSDFYGFSAATPFNNNVVPSYVTPVTNVQNKNNSTINNISFVVNESANPIETAENIADTLKKTHLFTGGVMV